ncbi:MAG: ABC transporter ATP-binding protein [Propionibacteriaceae bacterium]|jgi:iron complex transport system ATP-binding protein|nr:ABC transporter ATP-binding protein [Propionibacteriaceae bacterium]
MSTVIDVSDVTVRRGRSFLLDHVTWRVEETDRWVVIGPNGAGKTTLMQIVSAHMFPTLGEVRLLGERLGAVDVFELRPRIGVSSAGLAAHIPPEETVGDVVISAAYAVFGRWREAYGAIDETRAERLLSQMRIDHLKDRRFGTLSEGERQRTQVARALMTDPELLILDEPTAGLDLSGRELLLATLSELALDETSPTTVMVTHHVEEIPAGITHALFLKQGRIVAAGPLEQVMTDDVLSRTFDLPLKIRETDGRWYAQAFLAPRRAL